MDQKDKDLFRGVVEAHEGRRWTSPVFAACGAGMVFWAVAGASLDAAEIWAFGFGLFLLGGQMLDVGQVRAIRIAKRYVFRDEIPNYFADAPRKDP